jgi:hypothetical protein
MNFYDTYNREERAICAHLFRLLHEGISKGDKSALGLFLEQLQKNRPDFQFPPWQFRNVGIFCEVAIIRDAFQKLKPFVNEFMDSLTKLIMVQEGIQSSRLYSELPEPLNNPKLTHPKQIRQKAASEVITLTQNESIVYGAMQGMFNAKPDLVVTIDDKLLVFEAKFTESFDEDQLKRTKNISEIWSKLLYQDFGFSEQPEYFVIKLGSSRVGADINWQEIFNIAKSVYADSDRSFVALKHGAMLLERYNLT